MSAARPREPVEIRPDPLDAADRRGMTRRTVHGLVVLAVLGWVADSADVDAGAVVLGGLVVLAMPWWDERIVSRQRLVVHPDAIELWNHDHRTYRVALTGDLLLRISPVQEDERQVPVLALSDGRHGLRVEGRRWAARFGEIVDAVDVPAHRVPRIRAARLLPEAFTWPDRHPALRNLAVALVASGLLWSLLVLR